jgi:hypothetical protein
MPASDSVVVAALQWAAKQLLADLKTSRAQVIDEAARKFGLSPLQAELLYQGRANRRREDAPSFLREADRRKVRDGRKSDLELVEGSGAAVKTTPSPSRGSRKAGPDRKAVWVETSGAKGARGLCCKAARRFS